MKRRNLLLTAGLRGKMIKQDTKSMVMKGVKFLQFIVVICLMLTSCATIVNQPYKYMTIHTSEPSKIIYKQDTINTTNNKAHLKVERKKESISIVATTDSLTKSIGIEPDNSLAFWSNIFFNYGIGMLVDMNNPKRYSYPNKIFINSADTISKYSRYGDANNKGELYLHFSLPAINSVRMIPENKDTKANTVFLEGQSDLIITIQKINLFSSSRLKPRNFIAATFSFYKFFIFAAWKTYAMHRIQ